MRHDYALLMIRAGFGGIMLLAHGLPKLLNFSQYSTQFADPIGLGPTVSLSLAIFAEVFCAAAVVLGVYARWAAIPLVITMAVAAFVVHGADPFAKREMAMLFLIAFLSIALSGGGRFSLDRWLPANTSRD